jgi:hypothetical protein
MDEHEPAPPPKDRSDWLLVAVALAVVGGAGLFWYLHEPERPAPVLELPPAPPAEAPTGPTGPAAAPTPPPPPVPGDRLRALLGPFSADAAWKRWLDQGDLVNRWAVVTDNLAEGASPRRQLDFLAPSKPFTIANHGGKTVIAPEAYRRYDAFGAVVASVDAGAVARAYRELHPVIEAAWKALGSPDGSLDRVTARALARLAAAPVVDGDLELVPAGEGALYLFADPKLEALPAVEKHLLRMGPATARKIQAKARELEKALALPPAPPPAAPPP